MPFTELKGNTAFEFYKGNHRSGALLLKSVFPEKAIDVEVQRVFGRIRPCLIGISILRSSINNYLMKRCGRCIAPALEDCFPSLSGLQTVSLANGQMKRIGR